MGKDNNVYQDNSLAEYLFHEGTNYMSYNYLGAHLADEYCIFRVWAPNAKKVFVTGDFCNWNYYKHEAYRITGGGVFECVIKGVKQFDTYKYVIIAHDDRELLKADPYAFHSETPPGTASKVYDIDNYIWTDKEWLSKRDENFDKPMNVYELHFGSWKQYENGEHFSYDKMADELIPYVKELGYTHIELMPMSEYPYDKSWGYQVTGYFAPTSRYGQPTDFMRFINKCHRNNIGVILDWVPAHFPKDTMGLFEFDGTCCYEYENELMREHPEWGTRIFDYGKNEVKCFLLSSACMFIDKYHIDGIRLDAVASMLCLDYCRKEGEWLPNKYGGNENLEAEEFLKQLNSIIKEHFKGVMTIAEDSTVWPMVTEPVEKGGLGFSYKWNMGWMNDTLKYMSTDPLFRKGIHNNLTFSFTYTFSEKYILPLSHDEVVHGKCSLISKMPGYYHDKFANLRAYIGYMFAHPGKKLLFMGGEFAQFIEWDESKGLDFLLLDYDMHSKHLEFSRKINHIYRENSTLWEKDHSKEGFKWINADDCSNNVIAFQRTNINGDILISISNFSSQLLKEYKIHLDNSGEYSEIFTTDRVEFGGNGNLNGKKSTYVDKNSKEKNILEITLPPFSTIYFLNEKSVE